MRYLACFLCCVCINCAPSSPACAFTLHDNIPWPADLAAEPIGHLKRFLVVARHVGDDEGGSSIGDMNSVADADLGAAAQPADGERGAGGGTEEAYRGSRFQHMCGV